MVVITGGGGTLLVGDDLTLICSVSHNASTPYTYQWKKNDVMLRNQNPPNMYSFSPLREADVGRYNCRVSVGSMATTSNDIMIMVESE